MPMLRAFAFTLFGASLTLQAPAAAADLYRWLDNKGEVHYGDRIPPQYVNQGYKVINEKGDTVQVVTPAGQETSRDEGKVVQQTARDRTLLTTFGSEEEIIAARDRKLAEIDDLIASTREMIRLQEQNYRQLTKDAGDHERRGEKVPAALAEEMSATKRKVEHHQNSIGRYQNDRKEAAARFEADLARYRELTNADRR